MVKIYRYIKLITFVAFAILVGVFHNTLVENLRYLISSLMMLYGLENVIIWIYKERKDFYKRIWTAFGLAEFLIGLTMIITIDDFVIICVIWGVWSILREAIELHGIANGELKGIPAVISGVESIVAIIFSIVLIIDPVLEHAHTHMYLLIAELIVTGIVPALEEFFNKEHK